MKFVLFIITIAVFLGIFFVGGLFNYPNTKLNRSATNVVVTPNPSITNAPIKTIQLGDFNVSNPAPVCQPGGKAAVYLLLDNSTSMTAKNNGKKFTDLKESVKELGRNFSDEDVLGVQLFNPHDPIVYPIDRFAIHQPTFENTIQNINSNNGTPTASSLRRAKEVMEAGFARFPDYVRNLIMFTDGCPDSGQKPVPIAEEIRNEGIRIIIIGIDLGSAGKCDRLGGPEGARQLMEQMAPGNYYDAPDSSQLTSIVNNLKNSLNSCTP